MKRTNKMKETAMAILALLAFVITFSACSNDDYEVGGSSVIKTRAARHDGDEPEPVSPLPPADTIRACTQDNPFELIVSDYPETNAPVAFAIHLTWTEGACNGQFSEGQSTITLDEADKNENDILIRSTYGNLIRDLGNNYNLGTARYKIKEIIPKWEYSFLGVKVKMSYEIILPKYNAYNIIIGEDTIRPKTIDKRFGSASEIAIRYGKNF